MHAQSAPNLIEAEVFAQLPRQFWEESRRSVWVDVQRGGRPTPSLLEGPSFDRSGNLYVADIPWGRIFRISPDGAFELVVEYDGEPNGLCVHPDGRIFVADFKNGIMVLDPSTGDVETYLDRANIEGFKGVNDLHFSSEGDLYFTDQGLTGLHDPTGRVFRLHAGGKLECLLDNVPSPNGLVLEADETSLLLAVTRANAIWRVGLLPSGGVAKAGLFIQLSGGHGPDGLALDAKGNLAVCHVGTGRVLIFDSIGQVASVIHSPRGITTTNVAYGVEDPHEVYITEGESGSVLRARVPDPGRALYSHT